MATTSEQAQRIFYHSEYLWAECECLLKELIAGSKTVRLSSAQQAELMQEVIDGADNVADYQFREHARTESRSALPELFERLRHVIAHKAVALWNRTAGAMPCDPMEDADRVILMSGLPAAGPPETQILLGVLSLLRHIAEQVMNEGPKRDRGLGAPTATPEPVAQNGTVEDGTPDPFATPELRKTVVDRAKGRGTMPDLALRMGLGRHGEKHLYKWIKNQGEDWSKRGQSLRVLRIETFLKEAERARSLPEAHAKLSAP